jgi:hypothetical protein
MVTCSRISHLEIDLWGWRDWVDYGLDRLLEGIVG